MGSLKGSRVFRVPQTTIEIYIKFEKNSASSIKRNLVGNLLYPQS
jgi:hypothetical protein